MTTEEKAKAYEMALEAARKELGVDRKEWKIIDKVLKSIFPQLRESEDERIRKELVNFLQSPFINENLTDEKVAPWIAYLEKQKNAFENGRQFGIMQEQARQELEWTDEKQKEQKPNIELIQKSWYMEGYKDHEHNREPMWIVKTGEGGPKYEPNLRYGQMLVEKQKPAEKQDYSGLTDLERVIHRGFLSAGVGNVPVTIIKETAKECLAQMKPAEWSEEDEKNLEQVIDVVYDYCSDPVAKYKLKDWLTQRLKSLRPSWKPSEEHLSALLAVFNDQNNIGSQTCQLALTDLYEQLKKL